MPTRCLILAMLSLGVMLAATPGEARPVGPPNPPTPPNAAVNTGLSLEHECLNAVRATRNSPKMTQPGDGNDATNQAVASAHLDRAEEAARAGHGQACQDEVSRAAERLANLPARPAR